MYILSAALEPGNQLSCSLPFKANRSIVGPACWWLTVFRLSAAGRRFALTSFAVKVAIFWIAQLGVLCVGSTADGLRCRGAGVPALPDQLCSDGFCGDSATAATLGPTSPMTKRTHHGLYRCTCSCDWRHRAVLRTSRKLRTRTPWKESQQKPTAMSA